MITRMVHPQHGATHVYSEVERKSHELNGWTVDEVPAEPEKPQQDDAEQNVVQITRRGRPRKALQ